MTVVLAMDDGDDEDRERQEFTARHEFEILSERLIARRTEVMVLRNAGMTIEAIARKMKVSPATIRKDLRVVRRDINNEQPEDVIARHRAVVFDIQRANYPAMLRGDKDAAATILKALDREAKLLGLDAPTRVLANISNEEFAAEASRLIARINQLDPDTLKELERGTVIDAEAVEPEFDDRADGQAVLAEPPDQPAALDPGGSGADPGPAGNGEDLGEVERPGGADTGGDAAEGSSGFSIGGLSDDLDGWSNIGD